eukprot:scaffold4841_cov132-Cylindrotheca_fusiformis.AAC.3
MRLIQVDTSKESNKATSSAVIGGKSTQRRLITKQIDQPGNGVVISKIEKILANKDPRLTTRTK